MINTALPALKGVFQCGAVVKELLAPAGEPGSTPGDAAFSVSLYLFFYYFFFPFSLCFLALFSLFACFSLFVLLTLLIMHLDQYIF